MIWHVFIDDFVKCGLKFIKMNLDATFPVVPEVSILNTENYRNYYNNSLEITEKSLTYYGTYRTLVEFAFKDIPSALSWQFIETLLVHSAH